MTVSIERPAIVRDFSVQRLVSLDHKIDQSEGEGLRVRWKFGRELLSRRRGKQLPAGLLDQVAEATGKSRQELSYRMQFAERFPTEREVSNAVGNFGSWHRVVNEGLSGRDMDVHYSSDTAEWGTPQDLFDTLNDEFSFTLDVCANDENAKCRDYFDQTADGLSKDWRGNCWMNPPYGDEIPRWVEKAWKTGQDGSVVVCLVPGRVDTSWWWDYCRRGEIRFLRGRLKFGGASTSAPFPSAVVVFGPNVPERVVWWEWERG